MPWCRSASLWCPRQLHRLRFLLENGVFLLMGFELQSLITQVRDDNLGVWHAVALGLIVTVLLIVIRVAFVVPLIAILRRDQRRAVAQGTYLAQALDRLDARPVQDERSARAQTKVRRFLSRKQADFDSLAKEGLGWRGGAVLAWSGMRGVVTLAAAQSLPLNIPYRPQLILIAFTVAVVTLLAQGGTLPWLIKRLGIVGTDEAADRAEFGALITEISTVGTATLDNPNLVQDDGDPFDPDVIERVRVESLKLQEALSENDDDGHAGPHEQRRALRLRVLEAERAALLEARTMGSYSSRILDRAQRMLDVEESRLQHLDEGGAGH